MTTFPPRIAGPNLDDPDVIPPDAICIECRTVPIRGGRHADDCPVRLDALRLKNLPAPEPYRPELHTYSGVEIRIDGELLEGVTSFEYSIDPSQNLVATQTINIDLEQFFKPTSYDFSFTLKLTKRAHRKLLRAVDFERKTRTLWHVERGCGPAGHRNSKVSRKLAAALRRMV